ncbi:ABC transporter substrate-binding protein [Dysosmobacter sp.]|uniref:ABC transporter substrate-binding protein n=1 Tax=Dysosmobacter sp. TaxID=2591382 RepID=UPI002A8B356D|nr:ABC transporter substrate-binding protein [Dysosmobacter sp.]MDY3281970.1 ABC transporter substrate-binding protein [Dysosmobacter sp.]
MKFRKLALLSVLLPALLLSGCAEEPPEAGMTEGIASSQEETRQETPLPAAFSLPWDPDATLDPITCPDGIQQTIGALLYEGLFELDESLEPQKRLCAAAEYDDAALVWTFQLRTDAVFSDGTALTAKDAVNTLRRAMDSDRYRARLSCVQSVSGDGSTLRVTLNRPNAALPALLDIPIVKAGTEQLAVPMGTGPYFLLQSEEERCLSASENWWGGTQPIRRIELVDCSGSDAARYQFTSHTVQLITADLTGTAPLSAAGSFTVQDTDTTILQYVGINFQNPLLQRPEVRRALSLGIDREAVTGAYLSGHALPAQFPLSPVSPLYPSELERNSSLTAFTDAMEKAGLNSGAERSLTLLVNSENSFKVSVARYLAAALSVCDLKITVRVLPWEEYLAAIAQGDYDLFYGEVRLTADWDLTALLGSGGTLNHGGYSDLLTDQLLADCLTAADRSAAVKTLCTRFRQQAPILPVCFKRTSVLTQSGVAEGLTPTAANPFHGFTGCVIHLSENR